MALPNLGFEKIRVRVEGDQTIDDSVLENKDFTTVTFKNLVAHFYFINNAVGVKAEAESINLENQKHSSEKKAV